MTTTTSILLSEVFQSTALSVLDFYKGGNVDLIFCSLLKEYKPLLIYYRYLYCYL